MNIDTNMNTFPNHDDNDNDHFTIPPSLLNHRFLDLLDSSEAEAEAAAAQPVYLYHHCLQSLTQ